MNDSTPQQLTDDEFVYAFESCTLPNHWFRHKEHVRLAWLYLRRSPYELATGDMEASVRRYATHHGASQKYHHTVTLFWMRLVAAAMATEHTDDFEAFVGAHPALLDKNTLRRFYSAERLESAAARSGWVEPDLSPLAEVRRRSS